MSDLYAGVKKVIEDSATTEKIAAVIVGVESATVTVRIAGSKTTLSVAKPANYAGRRDEAITLSRNPRTAQWEIDGAGSLGGSGAAMPVSWRLLAADTLQWDISAGMPSTDDDWRLELRLRFSAAGDGNVGMRLNGNAVATHGRGGVYTHAGGGVLMSGVSTFNCLVLYSAATTSADAALNLFGRTNAVFIRPTVLGRKFVNYETLAPGVNRLGALAGVDSPYAGLITQVTIRDFGSGYNGTRLFVAGSRYRWSVVPQ